MASLSDASLRGIAARVAGPGGLAHVNELVPLLEATLSRRVPLARRVAVVETLQAVFTQLWHDGHMAVRAGAPAAASAGVKRRRPDDEAAAAAAAGAVAKWLRGAFAQFLDALWWLLATPEGDLAKAERKLRERGGGDDEAGGDEDDDDEEGEEEEGGGGGGRPSPKQAAVSLRVAALAGLTHFFAHAVTTEQQAKEGGQHFCFEQLGAFLRRLLAVDFLGVGGAGGAGADGAAPAGGGAWDPARLSPAQVKALAAARSAFLSGYLDEWDDVQYFALRALPGLAAEAQARLPAGSPALGVFARNAVDLLLGVQLPPTHAEWAGGEHGAWVRAQWDEDIPAAYEALDARIAAAKAAAAAAEKAGAGGAPPGAAAAAEPEVTISDAAMRGLGGLFGGGDGDDDDDDEDDDEDGSGAPRVTPAEAAAAARRANAPPPKAVAAVTPAYWLLHEQRRAFADAWVAVLKLRGLPPDVGRRVLLALPGRVLPHMPDRSPLLLADFLTAAVDAGVGAAPGSAGDLTGATTTSAPGVGGGGAAPSPAAAVDAVLALQSLFALVQHHGLQYPRFYGALYALATPATAASKFRGRFFAQLDAYLASPALPAHCVAAFMKRLARLALTGPPPVALAVLPLLYNCVKRHPAVTPLLHRAAGRQQQAAAQWPSGGDPYDAASGDYANCGALGSSLWEVVALTNHYYAPVAHAARALLRRPERPEVDVSAPRVSGGTYASLVGDEAARTVKRGGVEAPVEVPFAYAPPLGGGAGAGGGGALWAPGAVSVGVDLSA